MAREMNEWGSGSVRTSTLSTGEEVGYLKEDEHGYYAMFVIEASQFYLFMENDDNELRFIDRRIRYYPHKDKVKVMNGLIKFYNYARRIGYEVAD